MPSIDSVILGLLPGSSLPGLYKTLITNMLPNMSQIQKEEVYLSLKKASDNRLVVAKKTSNMLDKYEYVLDMMEEDPAELMRMSDASMKSQDEQKTSQLAGSKLSKMKRKMDLEALKNQLQS